MSTTDPEAVRRDLCATAPEYWIGRAADDIPLGWIDHMIRRLFDEWNRQMIRFEKTGEVEQDKALEVNQKNAREETLDRREREARLLMQLQRSLRELIRLETGRAMLRANKMDNRHEGARAALMRELVRLIGPERVPYIPGDGE